MDVAVDILRRTNQRHSFSSEDDTESIYSIQEKETDVVQDTDSEDYYDVSSASTLELEYEVATSDSDDAAAAQYEVLLGTGANGESSSGEDDLNVTAAIAAVLCDTSLEAWATDGEDSDTTACNDSLSSTTSGRAGADFSTCLQCNGRNDQPKVQYCDKCFQRCWQCKSWKSYNCFPLCNDCYKVRKNLFPPRPRGARKRKIERNASWNATKSGTQLLRKRRSSNSFSDEPPVKLTALQNCLSGLSQDSGLGSSQEIPGLNFDKIVLPTEVQPQQHGGLKRRRRSTLDSDLDDCKPSNSKTSRLEQSTDVKNLTCTSKTVIVNSAVVTQINTFTSDCIDIVKRTNTMLSDKSTFRTTDDSTDKPIDSSRADIKTDATSSKSSIITDICIPSSSKNTLQLEPLLSSKKSASLEELNTINDQADSSDSERAIVASTKYNKRSIQSNSDLGSIAHCSKDSLGMGPLPELKELCIICNVSPKNGIFLHGKIAHLCCCYKCAMKTWRISKRCPICNCKVKNVVKVFTN